MIDKDRLLAITDGIVAIAVTIMVLELGIPNEISLKAFTSQAPVFLAYFISFFQIFVAWHSHHDSFKNAKHIDNKVFFLNILWVFFITLVPFATGLVGNMMNNIYAEWIYVFVLFLGSFTMQILDIEILKLNPEMENTVATSTNSRIMLFGTYIISALLAFINPVLTLLVVGCLCLFWVLRLCKIKIND